MNYNELNKHSRDASILFDEATHTYTVGGKVFNTVTTLVEDCFEKFNAEYWAERKATADCPKEKLLAEWDEKGRIAREQGTLLHERIEHYYLGETPCAEALNDTAFRYFLKFAEEHNLTPYRSEWRIFMEECDLAGTLDFLAQNEDGSFELWDWKRSNKVVDNFGNAIAESRFGKHAIMPDIQHLPDTSYVHYALQLSIYRYILSQKYGIETRAAYLGIFHERHSRYHVVEVPYLIDEVKALLKR